MSHRDSKWGTYTYKKNERLQTYMSCILTFWLHMCLCKHTSPDKTDSNFWLKYFLLRPRFYKIDTFVSKWHPNLKKYIFCTRVYHLCCTVMCTKTTHQPHNPIKHRVKYLYKSNTEKNVYTTIFYLPWETFLDTHIISFDVIFSVAVALLAIKWTQ